MAASGITDSMIQYERSMETTFNNKPKYSKSHGVKMPDSTKIIAVLAGVFIILVVIATSM